MFELIQVVFKYITNSPIKWVSCPDFPIDSIVYAENQKV